jgi:hypothetical protein
VDYTGVSEKEIAMKNFFKASMYFGAALLFVLSAIWGSSLITKLTNPAPSPIPQVIYTVTCPKDIDSYKALEEKGQIVKLVENAPMNVVNGVFNRSKIVITKNETKESKVACGYLRIKARTSRGALESYEDVYINPETFGGHLNKINQFGPGDGNQFSEYFFSLDDIKYWENKNRRVVAEADWASLVNAKPELTFVIGLNTTDPDGFVDEVSIAYKCKSPITGEENSGCSLKVTGSEHGKEALP